MEDGSRQPSDLLLASPHCFSLGGNMTATQSAAGSFGMARRAGAWLTAGLSITVAVAAANAASISDWAGVPLTFEVNEGQAASAVQFLGRMPGYTLWLTPAEVVMALHAPAACSTRTPTGSPWRAAVRA